MRRRTAALLAKMTNAPTSRSPSPADPLNRHRHGPTTPAGIVLSFVAVASSLMLVTTSLQLDLEPDRALRWSALFGLPTLILARRGHFGTQKWQLPSPGAICYLVWLLGLVPALIEVGARPSAEAYFTEDAVLAGRVASLVWFTVFALALGPSSKVVPSAGRALKPGNVVAVFATVVPVWSVSAVVAYQSDMLSRWGSKQAVAVGSLQMAFVLLFDVLTPLMPPLGALVALRGPPRSRVLGWLLGIVGLSLVFLMSSRRLWIVTLVLSLLVIRHAAVRLRVTHIALLGIFAYVGAGPLQWAYRSVVAHDGAADEISAAADALSNYAGDREFRDRSATASSANLRQRIDVVSPLFGATQYVLDEGANLSPSMLSGIVRLVPTFVYPEKNGIADSLEFEGQLHRTGRFAQADLGQTPIAEFIFQFGLYFGALGGILYGLLGRLLNSTFRRATGDPAFLVLWASACSASFHFDAGTTEIFGQMRETLALFIMCRIIERTLLRVPQDELGTEGLRSYGPQR